MTELELRKQALLIESELNRLALHAECERLRDSMSGAAEIFRGREESKPWISWLTPIAGLALSGGIRRIFRGGLKEKLSLLPHVVQLFRAFKKSSRG